MIVIADASPLVALAAADALTVLPKLFSALHVPEAVFRECTVPGKPFATQLTVFLQRRVAAVDYTRVVIAVEGLGDGELEAMALYKQLGADRLLVDDRRARRVASVNQINVIGSVGVLVLAKEAGLIPLLRPCLDAIRSAGLYLSNSVIANALSVSGEE